MCGSDFTHEHHVSNGDLHDNMRSAQIAQPGTHGAMDIQHSIDLTLEKLNRIRTECDLLPADDREELFSAIEETRLLVSIITNTFDARLPAKKEDQPPTASA